jgi:hypothetical protein
MARLRFLDGIDRRETDREDDVAADRARGASTSTWDLPTRRTRFNPYYAWQDGGAEQRGRGLDDDLDGIDDTNEVRRPLRTTRGTGLRA